MSIEKSLVPVPVLADELGNSAADVDASMYNACALNSLGFAYCWGMNAYGQVGNGQFSDIEDAPVKVTGLSGVTDIDVGAEGLAVCAVAGEGKIYCWGTNSNYQIGNGSIGGPFNTPQLLMDSLFKTALKVSVGRQHVCAIMNSKAYCWGKNNYGQLGDGTKMDRFVPTLVDFTFNPGEELPVTDIAAGGQHTCAVINENQLKCWGYNGEGQLGNGTTISSEYPVDVSFPGVSKSKSKGVSKIIIND